MTDQKLLTSLELNRALYEDRGDDFVDIVAKCVEQGVVSIGEASVQRLLEAVRAASVRPDEAV